MEEESLSKPVRFKALEDAQPTGGNVQTKVRLWFTVGDRKHYVERQFHTQYLQGAPSSSIPATILNRIDHQGNHTQLSEDSLPQVLSGMPKNVKDFYLFDGERINQFTAPGSRNEVKRAIRKIVGVTSLEEVIGDLSDLAATLRREQKRIANNGASEAIEIADRQRDHVAELAQRLEATHEQIGSLREMLDALDKQLRDSPDTSEIQKRRDIYRQNLNKNQERTETTGRELRDGLAEAFPLLALPAIHAMERELNEQRVKGTLPGAVSQQLMQDLLEQNLCLCERSLQPGEPARVAIEKRFAEIAEQSQKKQELLELYLDLRSLGPVVESQSGSVRRLYEQFLQLDDERRDIQDTLRGITEQLEGLEVVNREGWEQERRVKEGLLHSAFAEKASLQHQLESGQKLLKELDAKVGELVDAETAAKDLFNQISWVDAAQNALAAIVGEFSSAARIEVEHRTAELWYGLLANVRKYEVRISPDFELNVVSPIGTSGLAQLSMGQQQCLGLAFITAVAQVAETKPPLVIDMPFGRLSEDVATDVAASLPSLIGQLVLFLLPGSEWTAQVETALAPRLARTVHLSEDDSTPTTRMRVVTA